MSISFLMGTASIALLLAGIIGPTIAEPVTLTVETDHIVRHGADHFVGVNLNYIRDSDANRPQGRPLNTALKEMGVRWLRYPGGEKSDFYLWAQPPYAKPHPVSLGDYAKFAGTRMDFDEYIAHCRSVGAEPYVVVGYDIEKRTGRTKAQWIESAAAWVHYANVVKKYHVRYWEIGNENWNNHKATPEEMAGIVQEFSKAMKAADPSIQTEPVGTAQDGGEVSADGAPSLDFISLSLYNCWNWKGYDHFIQHPSDDTIGDAETALAAIDHDASPADQKRLKVIVAETNSKDYSENGWPGTNTLGHTLVTFDTFGQVMAHPRVLTAMVWTTRWMNDEEAKDSQWYALGPDNEILPTGRAIALWGQFVQNDLIAVTGGNGAISGYASRSQDGRTLTIWLMNRGLISVNDVHIALTSHHTYRQTAAYQLSGTGPDDPNPHWGPVKNGVMGGSTITGLSCPGVSVTVLTLKTK